MGSLFQLSDHPGGYTHRQRVGGNVFGNHRPRPSLGTRAHLYRCHQHGIRADEGTFTDLSRVFMTAIVIAGDRPGAYVGIRTHRGITQVGEMSHLGSWSKGGVFDFTEVTHVHTFTQMGTLAQVAIWTHVYMVLDKCPFNHRRQECASIPN